MYMYTMVPWMLWETTTPTPKPKTAAATIRATKKDGPNRKPQGALHPAQKASTNDILLGCLWTPRIMTPVVLELDSPKVYTN